MPAISLTNRRAYRFGDFELKVTARVLQRDGKRLPLGSKAFDVLTCLVVNAGAVVTKEELLKTVWPESFVEEGNLSQHVFALRKALGDCSTYIVTVPGRGYQFTETVRELVPEDAAPLPPFDPITFTKAKAEAAAVPEAAAAPIVPAVSSIEASKWTVPDAILHDRAEAGALLAGVAEQLSEPGYDSSPSGSLAAISSSRYSVRPWMAVAALAAVVVAGSGWAWWRHSQVKLPNRKIVLAEFDNRTGDASFDVVLKKALEIDLDQSPFLDVMSESQAVSTLRLMDRAPDIPLTPELAVEVCERSNRQVMIAGSIASLGKQYLLTLQATDCNSGKRLAEAKKNAASKEEALAALDAVADKVRHALGESAQSVEQFQVPIAEATTTSLEALKAYSIGEYLLGRMGSAESQTLPLFLRSVELDPQFAMANVAVATSYYSLGEYDRADPYYQKAFDLSDHVSEKERLYIRSHYYADDLKDIELGIKTYQMWMAIYPRDWAPWLNTATLYTQLGQSGPATTAGEQALRLDATRGVIYNVLARAYLHADRNADARSVALQGLEVQKTSSRLHMTMIEIAFLDKDFAAVTREIASAQGKSAAWEILTLRAQAAASAGQYKQAQQFFIAAYESATQENLPQAAARILTDCASMERAFGMTGPARETAKRIGKPYLDGPETEFLMASLGDVPHAEQALARYESDPHAGTLVADVYAPRLRAAIALDRSKPMDAVAALDPVQPYDFAAGFSVPTQRGEAYLRAGQADKAKAEYAKILAHQGVDPVSPLFPLAHLGLARARAAGGDRTGSKAEYEAFFESWKNADVDIPALKQARAEYAKL